MPSRGLDWHSAIDGLRDGIIVVAEDGSIVRINPSACTLLACESEAMIGKPLETVVPERVREVRGQPLHRFLMEEAEHRDEPRYVPALRVDEVEIVVESTLSLARAEDGSPLLVVLLRRVPEDISFKIGEVGSAQTARQSNRWYQLVFENAPLGIFHFDEAGVITACNDVFVGIIGSSKRLLVGLDMTTLPNAEIVRCVREAMAGRHADYDGDYRSATGGKVTPVHVHFAPIMEDDRVIGGVGIVEDVTERKEAERALARAERMASLGTLAAGVAHEINNPLTYVITSIDVARMRLRGCESDLGEELLAELEQILGNAQEGADRVRHIVRDLKTFVRADDEKPGAVELETVIDSAIKLAWNEIRHRAELSKKYSAAPPVRGNESRLVQVFVNLLVNAAQAIPLGDADNQRIEVRIAPAEQGMVAVEVVDTGTGIAADDIDRVFEPFWSQRTAGTGTGLGLSIVHGIVNALGGGITVQSEPGRGSVFRVVLPQAEPASDQPPSPRSERRPSDNDRARILVIDDEPRLAQTVQIGLRPEHDVEACTSGTEALEKLRVDPAFDLVLCDLMLPDTTGPEIYEALRDDHPELAERFVFMTGGAFTPQTREFLRQVRNPRLEKPFRIDEIEQLLQGRRG